VGVGIEGGGFGAGERCLLAGHFRFKPLDLGASLIAAGGGVVDNVLFAAGGGGEFGETLFQRGNRALHFGGIAFDPLALALDMAQRRSGLGFLQAGRFAHGRQDFRLDPRFGCCGGGDFGSLALLDQCCFTLFDQACSGTPAIEPDCSLQGADAG
jgi:hypothetical protein